jgi:type VI secretion system secreted protein Hcp
MSFDAFLKIDGVPGESTDKKHKDWIEILSYSFGVSQMSAGSRSTAGAASSQRADFQDFSIMKSVDKATNKILDSAAKGAHIKTVTLELCRATGDKNKYFELTLGDVIISSASMSGASGADLPSESVTFNFGTIKSTYTVLDHATGASKGNVPFGWSLVENSSI